MLKHLGILIMKTIILFILVLVVIGCAQTDTIRARWDKNTEPDMSHYDLFRVTMPDSLDFHADTFPWPKDTSDNILASDYHYGYSLAVISHVFGGVDSLTYEWEQPLNHKWVRAYILAADSAGNKSYLTPSVNIIFMPDEIPPDKPGNYDAKTLRIP